MFLAVDAQGSVTDTSSVTTVYPKPVLAKINNGAATNDGNNWVYVMENAGVAPSINNYFKIDDLIIDQHGIGTTGGQQLVGLSVPRLISGSDEIMWAAGSYPMYMLYFIDPADSTTFDVSC